MWETTFPRLTHAGLGKPINEDSMLLSMHDSALCPCPSMIHPITRQLHFDKRRMQSPSCYFRTPPRATQPPYARLLRAYGGVQRRDIRKSVLSRGWASVVSHSGRAMWETTFQRLTHAGLGKPINEDNILMSMHDASLSPFPINPAWVSLGNVVSHKADAVEGPHLTPMGTPSIHTHGRFRERLGPADRTGPSCDSDLARPPRGC